MGYITEKKTVEEKIKVMPCVKCGSENIELNDCGYSSFNVAWGKCNNCGNEHQIKYCDWNISKAAIAKEWNKVNNPKILRKQYEKQIAELQKKIDALPDVSKNGA